MTKRNLCPYCGKPDDSTFPICGECYSQAVVDGSTEMNRLGYNLKDLRNRDWLEEELKFTADSDAWAWLAERVLPLMELTCYENLLKKVGKRL
jgi:hypothetical protein